jgi:hypothetical protein
MAGNDRERRQILQLGQGRSQPGCRSRARRDRRSCRSLRMRQVCALQMTAELEEINTHWRPLLANPFAADRFVVRQAPGGLGTANDRYLLI